MTRERRGREHVVKIGSLLRTPPGRFESGPLDQGMTRGGESR